MMWGYLEPRDKWDDYAPWLMVAGMVIGAMLACLY